eukprot:tig00021012_g17021.t1
MSFSFGTTPAAGGTPSFSFGSSSTPAAAAPAFGTSSSAPAFGTTQTSTPSFSFGGATTATQPSAFGTPAPTSSFNFGTSAQPASTPGATGATASPFGAPATSTPFGASTTSAFGTAPAAGTSTGFNFGTTATSTAAAPSSFSFSSTPAAGTSTTGGLFGASTQPSSTGTGLFGTSAPAAGTSTFSFSTPSTSTTGGLFGGAKPFSLAPTAAAPAQPPPPWESLIAAYNPDPANPSCRFRTVLYNVLDDPKEAARYQQRPQNFQESLWLHAVKNNPDPSTLYPVQATGFQDLRLRVQEQDKMVAIHRTRITEMEEKLRAMRQKQELEVAARVAECRDRHSHLAHRLLSVMRLVETVKAAGVPLLAEEEQFWSKLDQIHKELEKPGEFKGRIQRLQSSASAHMLADGGPASGAGDSIDDQNLQRIYKVLEGQQTGIKKLMAVLERDLRDLEILAGGDKRARVAA